MKRILTIVVVLSFLAACREKEAPKKPAPPSSPPPPKAAAAEGRTPSAAQGSYADAVERVAPGVVTIRAERRARAPRQHPFFNDPLFRDFFGGMFGGGQPTQPRPQMALGSGVIVQPDGTLLTNHHVVDGAEQIKVELMNHRVFDAKVVGSDPPSDLAVLKINA